MFTVFSFCFSFPLLQSARPKKNDRPIRGEESHSSLDRRSSHILEPPKKEQLKRMTAQVDGQIWKLDWKLVILQGCGSFMRSLEAYEDDHKFSIGCGHIFIKGGMRRPKAPRGTGPGGSGGGHSLGNPNRAPLGRQRARHNPIQDAQTPGPPSRPHNRSIDSTQGTGRRDGRGRGRGSIPHQEGNLPPGPGHRVPQGPSRQS